MTNALALYFLIHLLLVYLFSSPLPVLTTAQDELEVVLQGKQIADIAPPEEEEKPDKTKLLGLYDSRVEEEEVAATPYIPPSRRRVLTGTDGKEVAKEREDGIKYAAKTPDFDAIESEEGEDLTSVLPEEFFPNVKIGDKTYLNVLRYPKIAYFVRMKKIIKLTWDPQPVVGHYLFEQQIATGKIETTIALQIDKQGNLRRLFVARSSGFQLYDEEALRAIEASAPFAAPPDFLLDDQGVLPIVYTFIVYL